MNHKFPWFSFERKLHILYKYLVFKRKFKCYGVGSFVSPFSEIMNMQHIKIGERVTMLSGAWIMAIEEYADVSHKPEITIGDDTYIGHQVTISCVNSIAIGSNVTFGDNVYISDCTHSHEDIRTNILKQKLKVGKVTIGDRAWLGKNSVVAYNVEIGEHSIVGANSFVNKTVPPYTIVAGNPARPIKKYDTRSQEWISIK